MSDAHLLLVFLSACSIPLIPRHVQITCKYDSLANLVQVPYANIEGGKKRVPVVVALAAAVGGTVYSEQYEGWKLKYDTASFGVKRHGINTKIGDLGQRGISADTFVFR